MKPSVRSKLRFAASLTGIVAVVVVVGSFEFARMHAKSMPAEAEVVPACALEAARIALLEHEAATNDRVDDDYWLSPTTVHVKRVPGRKDWEPIALVGELGSVSLPASPVANLLVHDVLGTALWQKLQHVRLQT
jgi:hypothetical protein